MEGLEGPRSAAEQAIEYLLNRNFLLTALELVQEAGEAGLNHEVEPLIQFFKNPALFPPEAVAACNPENGALFAQVAHERQQELSQARYELALAREQLAALAACRQEAAQQEAAGGQPQAQAASGGPVSCAGYDVQLSPAQLRALHVAVLAHLQAHSFRVAALSFSKEAQLPAPRGAGPQAPAAAASLARMFAAAQQLEAQSARLSELEAQAEQQGRELAAARLQLEESRGREAAAAAEVDFLRGRLAAMEQAQQARQAQQQQQNPQEQPPASQQPHGQQPAPGQAPPPTTNREAAELGASSVFGPLGAAGALLEVAACMPRVLPNLLINKREELVPALCALCQEHPQAPARHQLAGLLFGLIKKPNESQRGMIARACVALAGRIGPARTLLELVPHLEDQVRHEAVERRLLVAEAAGALAPRLPPAQAAPTVLRLLEALMQDSQPQVRCQALSALERLPATLAHDPCSFGHVLRLLLAAAADGSGDVTQQLLQSTLPAVLGWVGPSELLVTQLLPQTLLRLRHTLQQHSHVGGAPKAPPLDARAGYWRSGVTSVESQASALLQMYSAALPAVRELALRTQPAWVAQAAQVAAGAPSPSAAATQQQGTASGTADSSSFPSDFAGLGPSGPGSRPGSSVCGAGRDCAAAGVQQRRTTGDTSLPSVPAPLANPLEAVLPQQAGAPLSAGVQEGISTGLRPASTAGSLNGMQENERGALARSSSGPPAEAVRPGRDSSSPLPPGSASQAGDGCPTHLPLEQGGAAPAGLQPAAAGQPRGVAGSGTLLQRRLEAAAFAAWVRGGGAPEDWQAVDYIAVSATPELLGAALLAAALPEAALLTQRFVAALKATCLCFGEAFAAAAVVPQLQAAAGIPPWSTPAASTSPDCAAAQAGGHAGAQLHVRLVRAGLLAAPATPAQQAVHTPAALALLLAGALPYAGPAAAGACLRCLCTDGGSGSGAVWALEHPRPFVAAVRAAAEVQLVQAQLVPLMWELVASRQPGPRLAAALLAGAAAPALPKQQVTRQLLPLLATLGADRDPAACSASVAAAAVVFGCLGAEQEVQEALFSTLDDVLIAGGHTAEMALLAVLAPLAPKATSQQLEWLLQRLLHMLAAMHQRGSCGKTPAQLAEAAATAFVSLRQIEAHEFAEHRLHMHFAAALTALQREADLLDQPQRDALAAMIEDHEAAAAGPAAGGAGGGTPSLQLPPLGAAPAVLAHHPASPSPAALQQAAPGGRGSSPLAGLFAVGSCLGPDDDLPISAFVGSPGQAQNTSPQVWQLQPIG